jgi:hypothetical protein
MISALSRKAARIGLSYYSFQAGLILGLIGGVVLQAAAMYAMLHGVPALIRLLGGG